MNRKTALEILGLDELAPRESIEKTYLKLINRYPPEFHPDKFRQIDDAYRFLTSYPRMIEMLFASESSARKIDPDIFYFGARDGSALLKNAMRDLKRVERLNSLFSKN